MFWRRETLLSSHVIWFEGVEYCTKIRGIFKYFENNLNYNLKQRKDKNEIQINYDVLIESFCVYIYALI